MPSVIARKSIVPALTLTRKSVVPALTLTLVAGAAYLQAVAVAHFVAPTLLPSPKALSQALAHQSVMPAEPRGRPADDHVMSAQRVLERNPFDSDRGSLLPQPSQPDDTQAVGPGSGDPYAAPPCEGVSVLATAAGKPVSDSFAVLSGGAKQADAAGVLRRQGDEFEGKQVWLVSWDRVWLSGPGSFCQALLYAPAPAERPGKGPKPAPQAAGAPLRVRQVAPGSFEIDRSTIEGLLDKQTELLGSVRAKPESVGGKTVGLRVQSIKPGSPLAQVGIEPGDLLETINGVSMADPAGLIDAYAKLRIADRLRITLTRGGKPTTLEYAVR